MGNEKKDAKVEEKQGGALVASKTNAVAGPVADANMPAALVDEFSSDEQEFGANYSQDQLQMPFLVILQSQSPQCLKGKQEFIQGAEAGMIFNTVTKQLYKGEEGVNLIMGTFKDSYIEWVPRNKGGGFVAEYPVEVGATARVVVDPDQNRVIQEDSNIGSPGNHLSLTHTRLCCVVTDDYESWNPVVLSMSASQLGVSANVNTRHKLLEYEHPVTGERKKGPPRPFVVWRAKTKFNQNDKGSWYGWDIEFVSMLNKLPDNKGWSLYGQIREFILSSRGKAMEANAAAAAAAMQSSASTDAEEVPF